MRIFYTIFQALESIKEELEEYEKEIKKMGPYAKDFQRRKMLWCFERGVKILSIAKKGEIKPETYDWFLGRTKQKHLSSQKKALQTIKENKVNKVK